MNKILKKISVVIPAYNESRTVGKVIKEAFRLPEVTELILVDDGSTDNTQEKIIRFKKDHRFVFIRHKINHGKGSALKTGITRAKNETVLLLDADLKNITVHKIRKIITPVIKDEVDVSRAGFELVRGRVTEIAVKPMMKILFPDLIFNQPISGQICAKKEFLMGVNLENRWGVDIGILLDAIQTGQRVVEVDIGKIEHKARPDSEKAEMAQQVLETMIKKAGLIQHKYKLVIFTLDDTLINQGSLSSIYEKIGISKQIKENYREYLENKISFKEFIIRKAKLFKGLKKERINEACQDSLMARYAKEVISSLKKRKYQVAIISSNFSAVVSPIAEQLAIEIIDCPYLEEKRGTYTGSITSKSTEKWANNSVEKSYQDALLRISNRVKTKPLEALLVAQSPSIIGLMNKVGFTIAYRPKDSFLRAISDKTINILPEILAIVE